MTTLDLTLLFHHLDSGDAIPTPSSDRGAREHSRTSDHPADATSADIALARRVAEGDVAAFDDVFRLHFPALTRYVRRFVDSADVAEDLAQDALVQLWHQRASVRTSAPLTPLLRTMVRRAALNHMRHLRTMEHARSHLSESVVDGSAGSTHATPATIVDQAEVAQTVQKALATLPPRIRLVAVMRWLDELGRQEIAAELGVSVRTVDAQLYQAAARIRAALAPYRNASPTNRTSEGETTK